ncbi:MAG: hypothetical protein AB8F94_29755 [Saprospiraceae bacterium]
MKNLVIILVSLFPFIGFSQQTSNEEIRPNSKIYFESGIESFSKKYDDKQPTEIGAIITTVEVENLQKSHFELYDDECRTTRRNDQQTAPLKTTVENSFTIRVYESAKIYHEIKVPTNSKKRLYTIHHQHR